MLGIQLIHVIMGDSGESYGGDVSRIPVYLNSTRLLVWEDQEPYIMVPRGHYIC